MKRILHPALFLLALMLLAGCASPPRAPASRMTAAVFRDEPMASPAAREVGMYALMLLHTGYQFGGKNPSAGLDCSGLVTHVYREAAAMPLKGNAAALARQGRPVVPGQLRTGDLVFFNTLGHSYSHVGIYLGNGDFIHAPSARGRVRVENLATRYWSERFEAARTLLD
jgi:cell wall-associated NlpC family hydrolase